MSRSRSQNERLPEMKSYRLIFDRLHNTFVLLFTRPHFDHSAFSLPAVLLVFLDLAYLVVAGSNEAIPSLKCRALLRWIGPVHSSIDNAYTERVGLTQGLNEVACGFP